MLRRLNSAATLIQRTTTEAPRGHMYYIGLDVHKKTISYCVKDVSGRIQKEGKVGSTRTTPNGSWCGSDHGTTWALEIGDVSRFRTIKQAISYCGLCGDERSSADKMMRMPLSKQRNKHIQRTLVEAAKLAPRQSHELAVIYDREKQRGNGNRATLAVARKMVAYLLAVDRQQRDFTPAEERRTAAA